MKKTQGGTTGGVSPARLAANRRNAQKSTGPRTDEGKAAAAKNAMRHGLLSKDVVLPDENPEDFDRLRDNLWSQLEPVGEVESLLTERIALCAWRLMRAGRIEVSLLRFQLADLAVACAKKEAEEQTHDPLVDLVSRPSVADQAKHAAALDAARAASARRDANELGALFVKDAREADGLAKLSRYEAALDRHLYRALHELQRLQSVRAGGSVPPPAVVDLDVRLSK